MLKYHLETIEVGAAGASQLTFTNIPQIYDDLEVVVSARNSSTQEHLVISLNGSTSNFVGRYVNNGVSTGSYARYLGNQTRAAYTANTFGNARAVITNYRTSASKVISSETVAPNNSTTNSNWAIVFAGNRWESSAPITSLTLTSESGSNFVQYTSASLYGIKWGADGVTNGAASGGTITTSGGYTIHTFTGSGTFTANRNLDVEYLVVGGGGGGGNYVASGGGGAGGYRCSVVGESSGGNTSAEPTLTVSSGTSYAVLVGAGGTGQNGATLSANGAESSFAGIVAVGGGGGGGYTGSFYNGRAGGSGGGAAYAASTPGLGTTNQGFAGGNGIQNGTDGGGGGGGAGQVGQNASLNAGNGGNGLTSSITGTAVARGGGGGGARYTGTTGGSAGSGGLGGGGNGVAASGSNATGGSGTANTGGGAGGSSSTAVPPTATGANGGSGIVIIRYRTPA